MQAERVSKAKMGPERVRKVITESQRANELTLTDAAREHDVPKSAWSKAAKKKPEEPGYLLTRQVGRNRFVQKRHAKRFANDYNARREQRMVGSKRRR